MNNWILNLFNGTKLSLFLSVDRNSFVVSVSQVFSFYIFGFIVKGLIDYIAVGEGAQFNWYGIPYFVYVTAISIFGSFIIAQFLGIQHLGRFILISVAAFFMLNAAVDIYHAYAYEGSNGFYNPADIATPAWVNLVLLLWSFLLFGKIIIVTFNCKLVVGLGWSFLFHIFAIGSFSIFSEQRLFWSYGDKSENEVEDSISVEQTYYNQDRLLKGQLDNLTAEDPSKKDVYLATFASYGYQDVFKSEVEFVEKSVTNRYGANTKALRLINHKETVDQFALANQPNLAKVLSTFNSQMDIENDLLMLYLTSHGSKDAILSAKFWPIQPEPISASVLRETLDEAGIKWRVIIVSACYSGSFIEYLQDPNTLIITASAKEKTSFGCDDSRELTFFAEAFFKYAWPKKMSLINTFEAAKEWVTKKEREKELKISNPQIYVGENIKEYLYAFER